MLGIPAPMGRVSILHASLYQAIWIVQVRLLWRSPSRKELMQQHKVLIDRSAGLSGGIT